MFCIQPYGNMTRILLGNSIGDFWGHNVNIAPLQLGEVKQRCNAAIEDHVWSALVQHVGKVS